MSFLLRRTRGGFTLMEVCVALLLLSSGVLVFGRFVDSFNRVASLEREQAKAVVCAAAAVEELVRNPPPCADSAFALGVALVELRAVPGAKALAWVDAKAPAIHEVRLRRLVRCKKVR